MMGYHVGEIQRGEFGEASKIVEEFEEWSDALQQKNPIMELLELSDLLGAIVGYTSKYHNIGLGDLIKMAQATERAFKDGTRNPRSVAVQPKV